MFLSITKIDMKYNAKEKMFHRKNKAPAAVIPTAGAFKKDHSTIATASLLFDSLKLPFLSFAVIS